MGGSQPVGFPKFPPNYTSLVVCPIELHSGHRVYETQYYTSPTWAKIQPRFSPNQKGEGGGSQANDINCFGEFSSVYSALTLRSALTTSPLVHERKFENHTWGGGGGGGVYCMAGGGKKKT